MSSNFNKYNNAFNINLKTKWKNEYNNLNEKLKDKELDLLKLFLVKNYHLNKVYKKYVYKEITSNNSYYESNMKKIKLFLRELLKSKSEKKKENFQKMISSFKLESNKKYELLLKEEKRIKNDLKNFDNKIIEEYDKDIENWLNEYNNNANNSSILVDNFNNFDYDKEDKEIYSIFNFIDNKEEKKLKYKAVDKLKNYKNNYNNYYKIENSKANDIYNYNLIGNLNMKKNNENIIRLTSTQMHTQFNDFFNNDDLLEQYFNFLLKEIETSKKDTKKSNLNNNTNIIIEEKNLWKNIDDKINKILEEKKNLNFYKTKINKINNIINDNLGGIYIGWGESEHSEFLQMKNFYKEKSNSFIFLSSLNNVFPYMSIVELKKHIKFHEIYLKLNKIKKILIEKYSQLKMKIDCDKSRTSKQTSTSVTKSSSSFKMKRFFPSYKKNKMFFDFGNSHKSFYYTKAKFFDVKNKDYKYNEYLQTNYSKNNKNNMSVGGFRKKKESIYKFKNFSSISLNHSRNKISISNCSHNAHKKGSIKKIFNKFDKKK